jgi:DNA helicase HerA-like ATPase
MEKIAKSYEFLKSLDITADEMSVMFRLPKETGEKFNKFVKDEQLNNPITEKTRVVFISGKVPKTVIESNIKFNCVVNFSLHSVHYTIREFVKNHHNVIHILDKKPQRNFNFAIL